MSLVLKQVNTPFFSIIIPTFNAAKTLSTCLDSILNQACTNFEILLIDGCSTDDTLFIIKKYVALANANIKWISEIDKGIYDAMNKGIKLAKGEWLYFLGSDDQLYSIDVLYKIYDCLNENKKLDVIYGDVYSTRFNGIYDGEFNIEKIFTKNICHQAIFYKKNIFKKMGNYNIKYKVFADWDFNLRWFQSKKINREYINIICAEYADGGYSSVNNKDLFVPTKGWEYFLSKSYSLSNGYKYLIIKRELLNCIKVHDYNKVLNILLHVPIFFLK